MEEEGAEPGSSSIQKKGQRDAGLGEGGRGPQARGSRGSQTPRKARRQLPPKPTGGTQPCPHPDFSQRGPHRASHLQNCKTTFGRICYDRKGKLIQVSVFCLPPLCSKLRKSRKVRVHRGLHGI